ncbi:MAG: TetR family transcriptional regulator [Actinomycetota bacterium]
MDALPSPRRRADAARNDELLLDAGMELLREKGPDRLSALDLARRAGLTTGAVYARYENNEEILVGLWQKRLSAPLRQYFTDAVRVLVENHDTDDPIVTTLTDPRSPLLAGISLLIATPRITELNEVVIPDVRAILHDLGVTDDPFDLRSLHILASVSTALGCLYFAAADMFHLEDWSLIRAMLRHVTGRTDIVPSDTLLPTVPFVYLIDTGHEIRDALVNAAAGVIARSGMERATTQRVARAADLPPSALFSEYQNRQALFADVAAKLLQEIYQEHRYRILYGQGSGPEGSPGPLNDWDDPRLQFFRNSMVTNVAANTQGLLSEVGRAHRRIRLEFQLAAIHNADVRAELQRVDASTTELSATLQRTMFNFPTAIAGPGSRTTRTIAQGAMLLEDVSQMVNGRDIRAVNGPVADFCCLAALGRSTEPTSTAPNRR